MTHAQKKSFRLSAKRTSSFKSAGGCQFSRLLVAEVCGISGSNTGFTMFRGSVKSTGYPFHSPVSPFTSSTRASPCAITFQLESTKLVCPDLLVAVGETSYGIRMGFIGSTYSLRYLFMYLFVYLYLSCKFYPYPVTHTKIVFSQHQLKQP